MNIEDKTIATLILDTTTKFLECQFNMQELSSGLKVTIQEKTAFISLKGVVSKAEKEFSKKTEGEELVRNVYHKLFDNSSVLFEGMLKGSTGKEVRNINVEIEAEHQELFIVVHFKEDISQNSEASKQGGC